MIDKKFWEHSLITLIDDYFSLFLSFLFHISVYQTNLVVKGSKGIDALVTSLPGYNMSQALPVCNSILPGVLPVDPRNEGDRKSVV